MIFYHISVNNARAFAIFMKIDKKAVIFDLSVSLLQRRRGTAIAVDEEIAF